MTIRLIGLNHGYQLRGVDFADWSVFEQYLLSYTTSEGIDLIAEELSDEAVRKWNATDSVARHVAHRLGVRHLFCDPESEQRRAPGIRSFREIVAELELLGQVGSVEAKEKEDWPIRERFWLERLREMPFSACVFILGSQHVESFELLLRSESWETAVVEKNWKPFQGIVPRTGAEATRKHCAVPSGCTAMKRRNQPNTYEDPGCQETYHPYERFFCFFPAFQGLAQSTIGRMS